MGLCLCQSQGTAAFLNLVQRQHQGRKSPGITGRHFGQVQDERAAAVLKQLLDVRCHRRLVRFSDHLPGHPQDAHPIDDAVGHRQRLGSMRRRCAIHSVTA